MPRNDDVYYRRRPGLLLTSEYRYRLTRAQWAIYNDLLDLLYLHHGSCSADQTYLRAQLLADETDLGTVLDVHHFYVDDDSRLRHRLVDLEIEESDNIRNTMRRTRKAKSDDASKHAATTRRSMSPRNVKACGDDTSKHAATDVSEVVREVVREVARAEPSLQDGSAPSTSNSGGNGKARSAGSGDGAVGAPPRPGSIAAQIAEYRRARPWVPEAWAEKIYDGDAALIAAYAAAYGHHPDKGPA